MTGKALDWRAALVRAVIGLSGGFALAQAFVIGATGLLVGLGLAGRGQALVVTTMLAFPVWTLALLFAFAVRSSRHAAAWILGTALLVAGLGMAALEAGRIGA